MTLEADHEDWAASPVTLPMCHKLDLVPILSSTCVPNSHKQGGQVWFCLKVKSALHPSKIAERHPLLGYIYLFRVVGCTVSSRKVPSRLLCSALSSTLKLSSTRLRGIPPKLGSNPPAPARGLVGGILIGAHVPPKGLDV